jgi:PEP-CTERM motif
MRIQTIGGAKCALAISLMALGMAGTASAAFTACPTASPALPWQISPTGTITSGGSTDSSFTCGGLSFSNFSEVDAGGSSIPTPWSGHVDLVTAGSTGGTTTLGFNPNLSFNSSTATTADLWLFFTVSGAGLDQVDLSVTGVGSSVSETVCAVAFGAGNSCSQVLTSLSNSGANSRLSGVFGPVSTIYIFKDIHVGPVGDQPGHLTSLGQSFHSSAVPEPATLSMMGLGLLGLGLIGRRRKS